MDVAQPAAPRRFSSPREAARELAGVARTTRPLWRAYRGSLSPALRERVMVAVSQANACAGCTQVHQRWAVRSGVSHAELDALGVGDVARLDGRSRVAVVYAVDRAEQRFHGPPTREVEIAAREQLTRREIAEVEAVARAVALANLSLNTLSQALRHRARKMTPTRCSRASGRAWPP